MRTLLPLGLLSGILLATASGQIVPEVIYYRFNEGAGTSTLNAAVPGAGSPFGTLNGSLVFGPGRFGTGLVGANLSAGTSFVATGYAMALQGQSWTIEFWFNPGGTTSLQYLYGNAAGGGNFRGWCGAAPGSNMLISGNGLATNSNPGSVPAPGTWVHYAWVFDASLAPPTVTPYLNGSPLAPIAQTGALTLNTGTLIVGGYGTSNGVLGTLDEFRLWLRARTAAEISQNYNVELYSENILVAQSTGGGVGDLNLSLTSISAGAAEGFLLLSGLTSSPVGFGPILGLWPDSLTWFSLSVPIAPGNPFHFPVGIPGVFPAQPFVLPPGTMSNLAGTSLDVAALLLGASGGYAGRSYVARIAW